MNKLKLTMFLRWAGAVLDEWAGKAKPSNALAGELHTDIRNAAGREVRFLLASLGKDPRSKLSALQIRRTIRKTFGPTAKLVRLQEPFAWNSDGSIEAVTANHSRAQQLLTKRKCDVLVVPEKTGAKRPLLHLVAATSKAPTCSFLEKFNLPVPFRRRTSAVFAARLFVACTQVIVMGQLRVSPLQKLTARLPAGKEARDLDAWGYANIGFLHLLLGEQTGSVDDLERAADTFSQALAKISREHHPAAWARINHDHGIALRALGERTKHVAVIERAAEAFRVALAVRTREHAPLAWAATQTNLGLALAALYARKSGDANEAIEAFGAALSAWTRERAPHDWAELQGHLGRMLLQAGERNKDQHLLEQAVAALRAGLEQAEGRQQLSGVLQQNLGNALLNLADFREGTTELRQAIDAFRSAQTVHNKHGSPQHWSAAQSKIGFALLTIGTREKDPAFLKQAVAAHREALKVRTRKRMPELWANSQVELGTALQKLGELENDPAPVKDAIAAWQSALEEKTRDRLPLQWAATQSRLGSAYLQLGRHEAGEAFLQQSVAAYRAALEVYQEAGLANPAKAAERNLAAARARLNSYSAA